MVGRDAHGEAQARPDGGAEGLTAQDHEGVYPGVPARGAVGVQEQVL